MNTTKTQNDKPETAVRHKCDNCEWRGTLDDWHKLLHTTDLADRLEPGEEVPAGTCPECGALAYLDVPPVVQAPTGPPVLQPPTEIIVEVRGGLVEAVYASFPKRVTVKVLDRDNGAVDDAVAEINEQLAETAATYTQIL